MFIEAQAELFRATPQVIAVDRAGEGFVLDSFFDRRDFQRIEALVRAEDYPREMELATRKGSSPTL